jgi:hypothetical protein
MDFDDLETYDSNTEHDMWVDINNHGNTGTPDVFEEDNIDDFIYNLNEWN